jgi:hypothetical protein
MSHRPVNRPWLLSHAGLKAGQLDQLLRRLQNQEALEVLDAARYAQESTTAGRVKAVRVEASTSTQARPR